MSVRKLVGRTAGALCVMAAMLALSGASASAFVSHPFLSSFGSFSDVEGIAVDQATGDVFVYDSGAGSIYKFDSSGNPANFTSTGTNVLEGVGSVPRSGRSELAISPAGETRGDLYVANGFTLVVYSSETGLRLGELNSEVEEPPTNAVGTWSTGRVCGVAVDPAGNVYIGFRGFTQVDRFTPSGAVVQNQDYSGSLWFIPAGPCKLAADSQGNVYEGNLNSNEVTRYAASDFNEAQAPASTAKLVDLAVASNAVAVDAKTDNVYVDEGGEISEFGPHGEPFGEPILMLGEGLMTNSFGLAVSPAAATDGYVYASDGQGHISVFGASKMPDLTVGGATSATSATGVTATFKGTVDPDGITVSDCRFEYGPTDEYGQTAPCTISPGSGNAPVEVSSAAVPVNPFRYYHYRLVASNENGTNRSSDGVLLTELSLAPPPSDTCPNAAFRVGGLSEGLPDCRAYEMVSPLDKNGSDIGGDGQHATRASVDGDRASFIASAGFADTGGSGAFGGTTYVASRGSSGWSAHAVTPASPVTSFQELGKATFMLGFSSDLRFAFDYGYQLPGADPGTGAVNLYREVLASRGLETATVNTSGKPICGGFSCWSSVATGYASDDVGVITFQTTEDMTPEASGGAMKLYAWEHGTVRIAGVLPNGSLPTGGSASATGSGNPFKNPGQLPANESVSSDGSRILFVSPVDGSAQPQLYMRKNGTSTVWLSRSWTSPPSSEPEGVTFQLASPDGTKVLFTSRTPLLSSDPNNAEFGLYLYTDTPENAESEAKLSLIARLNEGGSVTAMSEDAGHIYIANSTASPDLPERGEYLWDNGTLHRILNTPIPHAGTEYKQTEEVKVSTDGRRLTFLRAPDIKAEPELAKPGPGQNVGKNPASPGHGYEALYLYDEGAEKVTCVSCPPSGAPMTAQVFIVPETLVSGIAPEGVPFPPRWLSSDGRFVFFSSKDALVPQDTNGLADVYEYDADTHEVKLLSSGTGENGSWFEDASANGSDVFFLTRQKLSGWDTDTLTDLYDARIDGGLPEPPPPVVPCDGDACQGIPSAVPSFNTASGFAGLGNQPSGSVVKAKKKGKPTARKRLKKKHGKHGRKAMRSVRHVSRVWR